jgi:glycerate-2-kinase
MAAFARQAQSSDLILFVLSGGASSLMEFLKPGISLADLQARTKQLLSNGADIREINRYRKSCSQIKGGGLGEMFDRAKVVCLVVSDVIGEDLSVIGSGPLYSEPNSIPHFILGNLDTAISAALRQAGLEARTDPTWIFEGEARDEAMQWVRSFLESTEPAIWIGGGEPVVTIRGPGKGGRCQEFATAAAKELEGTTGIALLAGSTDGSDGPTPFSGGIVNGNSVQLARERGVFIDDTLANNDSSKFLEACDGLIETGPTQSNVNDLYLLVRLGES